MKGFNVLAAFLSGAAVGTALGILSTPEKGEDTHHKIAEILRKKGIKLNRSEMENPVDETTAEVKGEVTDQMNKIKTELSYLQAMKVLKMSNSCLLNSRSFLCFKKSTSNRS